MEEISLDMQSYFAHTSDMEGIKRFYRWLEMFEEEVIVACFELQKDVLEEYFGELAEVVVIEKA